MEKKVLGLLFVAFFFSAIQNVSSKELILGFDGALVDLETNVDAFGVKFTGATVLACGGSLNCVPFPPFSGRNVIFDQPGFNGIITVDFDLSVTGPISKISARVTGNTNITMTAYDIRGFVIAIDFTEGPNYVGSNSGIEPNKLLTIDISTTDFVSKVIFSDGGNTFTVDDFSINSKQFNIAIDPGHGAIEQANGDFKFQRDPAVNGIIEDKLTLDISSTTNTSLKNDKKYKLGMTRTGSKAVFAEKGCGVPCYMGLNKRREWAQDVFEADIFVSIHTNGSDNPIHLFAPYGTEAYYCDKNNASDKLAGLLVNEMVALGLGIRTPKRKGSVNGVNKFCFNVLEAKKTNIKIPSALVEVAYHSHLLDGQKLSSSDFRKRAGEGVAQAIRNFIDNELSKDK